MSEARADIESLMARATAEDWSWLEAVEEKFGVKTPEQRRAKEQAAENRRSLARAAAKIFSTPEGAAVLEMLVDTSLLRTVFVTQLGIDPQQTLAYGAFREGQNALVFQLLRLIAEGRGEAQPPAREG